MKGWGGGLGVRVEGGGSVVLCSVQQLLKLTLFELGIVSDFVKCVRLHNLPVLKDGVQQVLEMNRTRRWKEGKIEKERENRTTGDKGGKEGQKRRKKGETQSVKVREEAGQCR